MKKLITTIIAIAITAFTVTNTSAQSIYYGPKVGLNFSNLTKTSEASTRVRGVVGLFAGYQTSSIMAFQVEALYSWQGSKVNDIPLSLNYLKIPILAKASLFRGLYAEAGLSFNFLLNAKLDGESVKNSYNSFDFSVPIGIGYNFLGRYELGLRYNIPFTNVGQNDASTAKNSVWSLMVAYRF